MLDYERRSCDLSILSSPFGGEEWSRAKLSVQTRRWNCSVPCHNFPIVVCKLYVCRLIETLSDVCTSSLYET